MAARDAALDGNRRIGGVLLNPSTERGSTWCIVEDEDTADRL